MINKLLPYYGVIMKKTDVHSYPAYRLSDGFSFVPYTPGREYEWCQIQTRAGMTENVRKAREIFEQKFKPYTELLTEHCIFIVDDADRAVASAALWPGKHFGTEHWRIHWVAVDPDYQGMGMGKALMTCLMDIFNSEDHGKWLYVTSQSWNYCAINIYYHFGFRPYLGVQPVNWYSEDFDRCNQKGWALIDQWIHTYDHESPDMLCLGEWRIHVSGDRSVMTELKKIFPMTEKDQKRSDGKLAFYSDQDQKITYDGKEMDVFLHEENLHDRHILRDIGWFYYHVKAAQNGRILVGKDCCEIEDGTDGGIWLIFLRKGKYREYDPCVGTEGLEQFWEIFFQNGNYYIRDIQFRVCHRIESIKWHVLRRQKTRKTPVSWQSFQNRMLSMAEQVIAAQMPLMDGGELICHFPYVDNENMAKKRNRLLEGLFEHMKPEELTGELYRGEEDAEDCF